MSKYKGLFTFDEDSHKYIPIPIAGAEGIIDAVGHKPTEPLIKDEKVRKAVRFKSEALAGAIEQSVKEFIDDIAELCGEEEE